MDAARDQLAGLRQFLARLKDKEMQIIMGKRNVTQREIGILEREIAFLETVLDRGRGDANA